MNFKTATTTEWVRDTEMTEEVFSLKRHAWKKFQADFPQLIGWYNRLAQAPGRAVTQDRFGIRGELGIFRMENEARQELHGSL